MLRISGGVNFEVAFVFTAYKRIQGEWNQLSDCPYIVLLFIYFFVLNMPTDAKDCTIGIVQYNLYKYNGKHVIYTVLL